MKVDKRNIGEFVTSIDHLVKLEKTKKSVVYPGGRVAAAVIMSWQVRTVLDLIAKRQLFVYIPKSK